MEPEAAALFCRSLHKGSFKDVRDEEIINAFSPGGKNMILDLGGNLEINATKKNIQNTSLHYAYLLILSFDITTK